MDEYQRQHFLKWVDSGRSPIWEGHCNLALQRVEKFLSELEDDEERDFYLDLGWTKLWEKTFGVD